MENENLDRGQIMPHENTMDRLKLAFDDVSTEIQREIRRFDLIYDRALIDGFVDDNEEQELITLSHKIALSIEAEQQSKKKDTGGLAIISGFFILVGAAFGVSKIIKL